MNKQYRYPGVKPFSVAERRFFYGRDKEKESLVQLINLENIVVLFSNAGMGKTSLLNAGITPVLSEKMGFEVKMIRFGNFTNEHSLSLSDLFIKSVIDDYSSSSYLDKLIKHENTIWYHFKRLQAFSEGQSKFVIIFDQFEEFFQYPKQQINEFCEQLSTLIYAKIPQNFRRMAGSKIQSEDNDLSYRELELLYKPLKVKLVFSIRSEQLSLLNQLKQHFPNMLQTTFELQAFDKSQAENAIVLPAHMKFQVNEVVSQAFDYTNEALDAILTFLMNEQKRIDPFELQMLCQYIEKKVISENIQLIKENHFSNFDNIYKHFYNQIINEIADPLDREKVRYLIEEGLIFEQDKRRLSIYEGVLCKNFEISKALLSFLEDNRLLRSEVHPEKGLLYEISQEKLIEPILKSKNERLAHAKHKSAQKSRKKEPEQYKKEKSRLINRISAGFGLAILFLSIFFNYFLYTTNTAQKKQLKINKIQLERQDFHTKESAWQKAADKLMNDSLVQRLSERERENLIFNLLNSADLAEEKQDYKTTALLCQNALKLNKTLSYDFVNPSALNNRIAWLLILNGKFYRASDFAENALKTDSANPFYLKNYAHALLLNGKYEKARKFYIEIQNKIGKHNKTYKEIVVSDFKMFEKSGIYHKDMNKIKEIYNNKQQ